MLTGISTPVSIHTGISTPGIIHTGIKRSLTLTGLRVKTSHALQQHTRSIFTCEIAGPCYTHCTVADGNRANFPLYVFVQVTVSVFLFLLSVAGGEGSEGL